MNDAGGVLTGRPGNHRAYAESPQGIEDAIRSISKVAGGLKGQAAVNAIVRRYERPADPNGEVASALADYGKPTAGGPTLKGGQVSGGGSSGGSGGSGSSGGFDQAAALKQALLSNLMGANSAFASGGQDTTVNPAAIMQQLAAMQQMAGGTDGVNGGNGNAPTSQAAPMRTNGMLKFLGDTTGEQGSFLNSLSAAVKAAGGNEIKITSGYRDPQHNAAVGGVQGSLHTQGKAIDGYAHIGGQWVPLGVALKAIAAKYGLRSGDQAGFFNGGTDPVHVDAGYGK